MKYSKELLRNIYWAFSEGTIETQEAFVIALKDYYKAISGKAIPLNMDAIIFEHPQIVLQYVKYTEDEVEEPQELLIADNGLSFTTKELLFKIHTVIGSKLEDDDNVYFEGLTFATLEDPDYLDIPVYFLDTGS